MTFFVSSVLDNLTSTIVMVSLLRKLVPPSEYRKYDSICFLILVHVEFAASYMASMLHAHVIILVYVEFVMV